MNEDITNRAISLARMWATSRHEESRDRGNRRFTRLLLNPGELAVAARLGCGFTGATSAQARARALAEIDPGDYLELSPVTRATLALGRTFETYAPRIVGALAAWRRRSIFSHFALDGTDDVLTRHITVASAQGQRLNFQLLTDPPITTARARAYAAEVLSLLERPDVDYLSVTPTHLIGSASPWDVAGTAQRIADRLRPLLRAAAASSPHKFINFDNRAYVGVAVTTAAFEKVLSEEEFMHLAAGITIQAYLPGSVEGAQRLITFATQRVQAGGAPIKVRLVKGGNLDGERHLAQIGGWVSPTYDSRLETDANYLRLIDMLLQPRVAYALRLGVGTHNLFHVAYAHLLAQERGLGAALDVEMNHVSGPLNLAAVRQELNNPLVVSTPVLPQAGWDGGTSVLVGMLAEAGREGSFLADLATGDLQGQEEAFLAARAHEAPARTRRSYPTTVPGSGFATTPASDPALSEARTELVAAVQAGPIEDDGVGLPVWHTPADVDEAVEGARAAGAEWALSSPARRDSVLRRLAREISSRRASFVAAVCAETGKTLTEADAEVSEAIDHAVYCANEALQLPRQAEGEGLEFTPDGLVAVVTPRTAPLAAAIAGAAAGLAAGTAVIIRTSGHTPKSAQLVHQALRTALGAHDVAEETALVASTDVAEAGRRLIAHPHVDSVILTGHHATAALFTSWRVGRERGARVFAAAEGHNTIVVTPTADFDAAARAIVGSAFLNAGQSCLRASTVILVGEQAATQPLVTALVERVKTMNVDWGRNPAAQIGGLAAPATNEERAALESTGEGHKWLLAPQQLDDAGKLWRPGIVFDTGAGAASTLGVPVLTVRRVSSLGEAVDWHNSLDYGLAAGIYSRSMAEINEWLGGVEAGTAFVNREFSGPSVGRAPVGGWKASVVGPGARMGGPNFLGLLGQWRDAAPAESEGFEPGGSGSDSAAQIGLRVKEFLRLVGPWVTVEQRKWLESAARSDAEARDELRQPVDWVGVPTEVNAFRYRPGPRVTLRAGADAPLVQVLRIYAAALATGVDAGVSIDPNVFDQLPAEVQQQWHTAQIPPAAGSDTGPAPAGVPRGQDVASSPLGWVAGWRVEPLEEFTTRASTWVAPGRIRCIGSEEVAAISEAVATAVALLSGEVLHSGRRELLTFLREQCVSVRGMTGSAEGKLDLNR